MALALSDLKKYCVHAVGEPHTDLPGSSADARKQIIVNQAGRQMYNARSWKFRERPARKIHFTAPLSITGATYTDATKTLTSTGGFSSYTHSFNDMANVTAGTGATTGEYEIATKTSSDAITLAESIGILADGQTDIAFSIGFPYVALPSDFGQLITCNADGLTSDFEIVDFEELARMRDYSMIPAGFMTYGAIYQPAQNVQTNALPVARLEIYPTPTATVRNALTITYRARWRELTSDTHYAAVPDFAEPLLIEYIRAIAEGYDNAHSEEAGLDVVAMSERTSQLRSMELFKDTVSEDARVQPHYGVMGAGIIGSCGSSGRSGSVIYGTDPWEQADPWVY